MPEATTTGPDINQLGRQGARVGVGYVVARIAVFGAEQAGFPQLGEIELEIGAMVTLLAAFVTQRWGQGR